MKISVLVICFMALILCFAACKKDIKSTLPDDKKDLALNFYIASDVMDATYAPYKATVAVYVDQYQQPQLPINAGSGNRFPNISFGFTNTHEYPAANNNAINYVRYVAGDHRLLFTDINNAVVLDTMIEAKAASYNSLYLADQITAPGVPAAYKLVVAEEDRKTVDGKTGVRFINLSPDAGKITCNLQKVNGGLAGTQAGELAFGQVSAYQYFNADDIASGGLLRFTLNNAVNGVKFNTGVPFSPGRNYVVLISGFRTGQQRTIATGKNSDGSIKMETVAIPNNLRAEIRRSY